ncbi:hypothetical protein LN042_19080 [Kitasatospora sp. RB6PN24]|uniref:hypothetical protein n=1 Tax=Kitasatospora humi TaxID=2893891 RepID=UPI001E5EEE36|nr:hypothetical protein [Kitasatospora humi]MCC9309161.1 hypothetical protein [Kitasatospora humi]
MVVEEVEAGRWMAMRELLAASHSSPGVRTARTQVLAAVAAGTTVVETWCREEPRSADAEVMLARVAVERALRAGRQLQDAAGVLARSARDRCWSAVNAAPGDPVPWVCLLALGQLSSLSLLRDYRSPAPAGSFLPAGPWELLHEAVRRDPVCREGHVRMLQFWLSRPSHAMSSVWSFVTLVEGWAPAGSPLLVLPLLAHAEQYRLQRENRASLGPRETGHWRLQESVIRRTDRAWRGWFRRWDREPPTAVDLNLLAHALWAGRRYAEAGEVFQAIGPHASRIPWAYVATGNDGPEQAFLDARAQCVRH